MKTVKLLFLSFLFFLSFSSFSQTPANDECVNRETITIGTSNFLQYSVNLTEATESIDVSCENVANTNKDVWYEFTMPIDGILFISNVSVSNYVALYDSCGGTEIACGNDETSFNNLTSGTTYVLRLSSIYNENVFFRVQAFSVAANDECVNREIITLGTSSYIEYTIDSRAATESIVASCDVATNDNLDLWYEFVMPVNGNVEISGIQFTKQTYSIYDSCGGTELQCLYEGGFFLNLTAGTTYILRVNDPEKEAGPINFRIQAFEFLTNNDCANSLTITVNTSNYNDYTVNLKAAFESTDSSCETVSNENFDLWYDFVMPVSGNLSLKQLSTEKVTLYDDCSGNELSCKTGIQFIYALTSGVSYKLRISSTTPVTRTLRIQAFEEAPNDECINSESITVDTAGYIQYAIDTRRATESLDASCETISNDNLDLWFEFTMPVTGNLQVSNVTFQLVSTLYDACSGSELECFNGNNTFFNLAFGTTYKLRVAQRFNDANIVNMRLQAFENIFNDDCNTPQSITIDVDSFNDYAGNVSAASQSVVSSCEPSSDSFAIQDIWYSFTMPIDGDLELEDLTTSATGYYALYDACANADLQCFNNDGIFTNLTAGVTYNLKTGLLSSQSGVLSFRLKALSGTLGFDENKLNKWTIFPNPTHNSFTINNDKGYQINNISMYDLSGRLVKKIQFNESSEAVVVDISELQNAIYVLEIKGENSYVTKRIIKH